MHTYHASRHKHSGVKNATFKVTGTPGTLAYIVVDGQWIYCGMLNENMTFQSTPNDDIAWKDTQ